MNKGTDFSEIPENVSLHERAKVIAGFANEVDDVKKYAVPIQAARTAAVMCPRFWWRSK